MGDISLNLDPALEGQPGYGDLLLVNGSIVLTDDCDVRGTEPTMQAVLQRLMFFKGEWFLDISDGTPWFQTIMVKGQAQSSIDAVIQERIMGTPGVAILMQYKSVIDSSYRVIRITFKIKTLAGVIADATVPLPLIYGSPS